MRAACYVGDRTLNVVDRERRAPAEGEVAIDVAYTGICGTDLHILHGAMDKRVKLPAVLGHEMAGTISAIGAGVDSLSVGERVTVMPLGNCGHCPACRSGNTHICHNLNFLGIDSPGSMQGSWTVPERLVVPVPATLSLEHAALTEPTAVAAHDVRRAALEEGERALVVGGGPIGVLVASASLSRGAEVVVVEPSERRRALVSEIGLRTVDPGSENLDAFIAEWTDGAGAEVSFEVSGAVAGIDTAIQALAVRGRMVVVAIHATPPPVNLHRVFWRELTVIGARVYERADFEEAVRLLEGGAIPAEALITRVEPLDGVVAAFAELESGQAMKVLIDCRSGAGGE